MENSLDKIIESSLADATSYAEYRELVGHLFAKGRSTGPVQTEPNLVYTELNIHRMNKWDKHFKLSEASVEAMSKRGEEIWLVLTESWCGDAAHSIPVMQKLADLNEGVELRVVLRDEQRDLMDHFLTNGGRSIPKLIVLDKASMEVKDSWGPRPEPLQELRNQWLEDEKSKEDISKDLQLWYARDRGKTTEEELIQLKF